MKRLFKIQFLLMLLLSTVIFANIGGGIAPTVAPTISVNETLTLTPQYGDTQKYAYYKFTVANDTETTISYTAPSDEKVYFALHDSTRQITEKLTAKGESSTVKPPTLSTGEYYFLIKKYGASTQGIPLTISLDSAKNDEGTPLATENNLVISTNPWIANASGTTVINSDGSITMTRPDVSGYKFLFLRLSQTGRNGALSRDLIAGETITVKIRAKSSSTRSFISSNYLDFKATRFTKVNDYQDFTFTTKVKSNISKHAWLGLFTTKAGDTVTVKSVEILEGDTPPEDDTTPPVITLKGENPLNLKVGDRYIEAGVTANDNLDGNISAKVVIGGDTVDTSITGTYTITYDVSDNAGNEATTLTRDVIVTKNTDGSSNLQAIKALLKEAYNGTKRVFFSIAGDSKRDDAVAQEEIFYSMWLKQVGVTYGHTAITSIESDAWITNNKGLSRLVNLSNRISPNGNNSIIGISLGTNDINHESIRNRNSKHLYNYTLNRLTKLIHTIKEELPNAHLYLTEPALVSQPQLKLVYQQLSENFSIPLVRSVLDDRMSNSKSFRWFKDDIHPLYSGSLRTMMHDFETIMPHESREVLRAYTVKNAFSTIPEDKRGENLAKGIPINEYSCLFDTEFSYGKPFKSVTVPVIGGSIIKLMSDESILHNYHKALSANEKGILNNGDDFARSNVSFGSLGTKYKFIYVPKNTTSICLNYKPNTSMEEIDAKPLDIRYVSQEEMKNHPAMNEIVKGIENDNGEDILPSCDTSNPKVQIIENINDWDTINNLDKDIFCVSPGDYSSLGNIKITASGTKSEPRYIILNNGNNKHPVQLDRTQLAKYRLEFDHADYWVVDRQAYWEDSSPHNRLLKLSNSSFNVFSRGLLEDTANGITLYNGSNYNTIQNFHMEKTQWSVDYATSHRPSKGYPPYTKRIFADLAAIGLVGENPDDALIGNQIINNEIINYVDGFQLVRINNAEEGELDASGTIIKNNIFYTTPILYTDGHGNFQEDGEYAVTENALDFKFGALDQDNPVIVKNNVMFGYREDDNSTYSSLGDNGNAFVLHFGAGNIVFEENYIFDCKNGFGASGPSRRDPAMYNITLRNNIFYDMKQGINHIYGTQAINSFDGANNVLLENNIFGKVGGFSSLHAYNTEKLTIQNNKFVNTKAMFFALNDEKKRSKDLKIIDNIFYKTPFMGLHIPYFVEASGNTDDENSFDWSPYKTTFKIRVHTSMPIVKSMGVE